MPKPKTKAKDSRSSRKIGVMFTEKQVKLIDELVTDGSLGGNRSEVIKQIVLFHIRDKEKKTAFP